MTEYCPRCNAGLFPFNFLFRNKNKKIQCLECEKTGCYRCFLHKRNDETKLLTVHDYRDIPQYFCSLECAASRTYSDGTYKMLRDKRLRSRYYEYQRKLSEYEDKLMSIYLNEIPEELRPELKKCWLSKYGEDEGTLIDNRYLRDEMKEISMEDFFPGYRNLKYELKKNKLDFPPREILYFIQLPAITDELELLIEEYDLLKINKKNQIIIRLLDIQFFDVPDRYNMMHNKRYDFINIYNNYQLTSLIHEIRFFFLKYKGYRVEEKEIFKQILQMSRSR